MRQDSQKSKVVEHIKTEYGSNPEFLWPDRYPSYAVFRHGSNGKWFALVATISSKSLGLEKGDLVEKDILVRNMVSNLEIDAQKKGDFLD